VHVIIVFTCPNCGKTIVFKVAPTARDAAAATGSSLGKLGSIIPEATSPEANTTRSGKKTDGLNNDQLLFVEGALRRRDSRPSWWFVKQRGSAG